MRHKALSNRKQYRFFYLYPPPKAVAHYANGGQNKKWQYMTIKILIGDCLEHTRKLKSQSVHCVVTSPPYWGLRNYGVAHQLGMETTPEAYVDRLCALFAEIRRVLRDDGTIWLNLGDCYVGGAYTGKTDNNLSAPGRINLTADIPKNSWRGLATKNLVGLPWRVALALQAQGWFLRADIIWHKPNPMPESVRDRPTRAHEYIFLLSKSPHYYYDVDAIRVPYKHLTKGQREQKLQNPKGKNPRTVWTIPTKAFKGAHFATYPPALIEPCIKAGCPEGGTVFDPFFGAGTTALVARQHKRNCIGIELNPDYVAIARQRLALD